MGKSLVHTELKEAFIYLVHLHLLQNILCKLQQKYQRQTAIALGLGSSNGRTTVIHLTRSTSASLGQLNSSWDHTQEKEGVSKCTIR